MPPVKKFGSEELLEASLEIVRLNGFRGLNARNLAKKMGCSVQPIFHNFKSMEDLNVAVTEKIYGIFKDIMDNSYDEEKPYLAKGMGYIKFARMYPEFFKILFMKETNLSPREFIQGDKVTNESVIKAGQKVFKLSLEEQTEIHAKAWIFAHGLACLVATNTIKISDEKIKELLGSTIREIIAGYKLEKEKE